MISFFLPNHTFLSLLPPLLPTSWFLLSSSSSIVGHALRPVFFTRNATPGALFPPLEPPRTTPPNTQKQKKLPICTTSSTFFSFIGVTDCFFVFFSPKHNPLFFLFEQTTQQWAQRTVCCLLLTRQISVRLHSSALAVCFLPSTLFVLFFPKPLLTHFPSPK